MLWLAPGADLNRALGSAPAECLRMPAGRAQAQAVEVGRAAFRTPVLLGGQAARAGVSCETCHRNGRTNPDFLFPGLSGPPGTADVTSALFSTHRGNGVDDPKPIPDLSGPKPGLKISQTTGDPALERFIHGLVVEEFDGPQPTPATLAGLAAYVRALDPAACPIVARQPLSVTGLMADARRALRAAQDRIAAGDPATAVVMIAGARARLGLIDERFVGPALAESRRRLRAADRRLATLQAGLRAGRPGVAAALVAWLQASATLERDLAAGAPASLFNPRRLATMTNRRLPAGPS